MNLCNKKWPNYNVIYVNVISLSLANFYMYFVTFLRFSFKNQK